MDNPLQPPQSTDNQALPVQPIVTGSANQTNALTGGMVSPQLPPAVANDAAWAARVARNNALNPASGPPASSTPAQVQFSRVLPSNGGPTPTFAPPIDHAKAGLAALLGLTQAHAAQGEALVASGQPPTPPPMWTPGQGGAPVAGQATPDYGAATPEMRGQAASLMNTQGGTTDMLGGPGAQLLGNNHGQPVYFHPASREGQAQASGIDPNHPGLAPHKMSRDEYIKAMANVPLSAFQRMQELRKVPSMQEQATGIGADITAHEGSEAFKNFILQMAQGAQYPINRSMGAVNPEDVQ